MRPIALAALRLITNSNLVGCMTGKSEGFGSLQDLVHVERRCADTNQGNSVRTRLNRPGR